MSPSLDSARVKQAARQAGFHACGIARATPLDPGPLDRILRAGAEADMTWLRTQRAERLDPALLLPGARSVIALALAYLPPGEIPPDPEGAAEVARYARGRDYHAVMKSRLKLLTAEIARLDPGARTPTWSGSARPAPSASTPTSSSPAPGASSRSRSRTTRPASRPRPRGTAPARSPATPAAATTTP